MTVVMRYIANDAEYRIDKSDSKHPTAVTYYASVLMLYIFAILCKTIGPYLLLYRAKFRSDH